VGKVLPKGYFCLSVWNAVEGKNPWVWLNRTAGSQEQEYAFSSSISFNGVTYSDDSEISEKTAAEPFGLMSFQPKGFKSIELGWVNLKTREFSAADKSF
jgi:hypothetical protein